MRRLILCAGLAVLPLLAGCSSSRSAWQDYFQLVRQRFSGGSGSTVSRDQAAAIPYASLGFRVDGSSESILVLATDTNGSQLWTSSSHVVLMIRGGRIVRTVGLPRNIEATVAREGESLPPLSDALRAPYRSARIVDLPDNSNYGVLLNCLARRVGPQTISIIGTAIGTIRVDETCQSANPRWSFTDSYWLDPDSGFVWHSVQHLHPSGTTIQIEIFRPPA